jgi:tyrosine-protein kinase Etk/Wzc
MSVPDERDPKAPVSEQVPLPRIFAGSGKNHFLNLFIVVAKHKLVILWVTVSAAVLSAFVSLLLPTFYTANARILPPQQNQSMAAAMLGQLGPLIGAAAGKDLGMRNPNDLYIGMLHSRRVEDALIDRFSLMNVYKEKLREDTRRRLESLTLIVGGKDNIISVSVDDRSAGRAADLANAYIDELQKLTSSLAVTDAARQRLFFEREMETASDELAKSEQELKRTQESTGIIQLDSQSKVMLESLANLRAQVVAKEVQLQAMRSFATPENPDLMRVEQELAALRTQVARFERGQGTRSSSDVALEKIPGSALEYVRRLREVKYRESLLELLTKQYEIAHIDESKDASIVQVLDKAIPPEHKSSPHRVSIVLLVTLLALLLAIIWACLSEAMHYAKEDPEYAVRLHLLKVYLSSSREPRNS